MIFARIVSKNLVFVQIPELACACAQFFRCILNVKARAHGHELALSNLQETDPICPLCSKYSETIEHLLFSCGWIGGIWLDQALKGVNSLQ